MNFGPPKLKESSNSDGLGKTDMTTTQLTHICQLLPAEQMFQHISQTLLGPVMRISAGSEATL